MNTPTDKQPDSFDYCIDFWRDALDAEDEIDHFIREAAPRRNPDSNDNE